jgi:hypothetical protein
MCCGPALIAAGGWRHARTVAVVTASLALVWQWVPAITAIGRGSGDASRQAAYFTPLIRYLETRSQAGRVEIPFTRSHWEAAFVAPRLPLARGWERQLDIRYNGLFYRDGLSQAAYHAWLRRMAVRYVALPDVPLDSAGQGEAALLRHAPAYLTPVFRSAHWTVWRVNDALPLAGGGVHVHRLGADSVTLSTARPASTLLRVHFTRLWTFGDSGGCASPGRAGWTRVRLPRAGVYTLHVSDSVLRMLGIGSGCAPS